MTQEPIKPIYRQTFSITHDDGTTNAIRVDVLQDEAGRHDIVVSDRSEQPGLQLERFRSDVGQRVANDIGVDPTRSTYIEQDWHGGLNDVKLQERYRPPGQDPAVDAGNSKYEVVAETSVERQTVETRLNQTLEPSPGELERKWAQDTDLNQSLGQSQSYADESHQMRNEQREIEHER